MRYKVDNLLYNAMECLELSDEAQNSVNGIIIYCTELYLELYNGRKKIIDIDEHLDESDPDNIAKNYFNYSTKFLVDGIKLDLFEVIMQNYYESKMLSLVSNKITNKQYMLDCIRLQMLFVLHSSKLLCANEKKEYSYLVGQFTSNKFFHDNLSLKLHHIQEKTIS